MIWWEGVGQRALRGDGRRLGEPANIPRVRAQGGVKALQPQAGGWALKTGDVLLGWGQHCPEAPGGTDALVQGSIRGCRRRAALLAMSDLNCCLEIPWTGLPFQPYYVMLL